MKALAWMAMALVASGVALTACNASGDDNPNLMVNERCADREGDTRCKDETTRQACVGGVWQDAPCAASEICVASTVAAVATCQLPVEPTVEGDTCADVSECARGLICRTVPGAFAGKRCVAECTPNGEPCDAGHCVDLGSNAGVCLGTAPNAELELCFGAGRGSCAVGLQCRTVDGLTGTEPRCVRPCTPTGTPCGNGRKCAQVETDPAAHVCSNLPPDPELSGCFGINEGSCVAGLTCGGTGLCVEPCAPGGADCANVDDYCEPLVNGPTDPTQGGCVPNAAQGEACVSDLACTTAGNTCVGLSSAGLGVCSVPCTEATVAADCGDDISYYCDVFPPGAASSAAVCLARADTGELCDADAACTGDDVCLQINTLSSPDGPVPLTICAEPCDPNGGTGPHNCDGDLTCVNAREGLPDYCGHALPMLANTNVAAASVVVEERCARFNPTGVNLGTCSVANATGPQAEAFCRPFSTPDADGGGYCFGQCVNPADPTTDLDCGPGYSCVPMSNSVLIQEDGAGDVVACDGSNGTCGTGYECYNVNGFGTVCATPYKACSAI